MGLRALFEENSTSDAVETASWKAYLNGVEVDSGTIDAISGSPDERSEIIINVEVSFDRLEFFSTEAGSDFHIEYIKGEIPADLQMSIMKMVVVTMMATMALVETTLSLV